MAAASSGSAVFLAARGCAAGARLEFHANHAKAGGTPGSSTSPSSPHTHCGKRGGVRRPRAALQRNKTRGTVHSSPAPRSLSFAASPADLRGRRSGCVGLSILDSTARTTRKPRALHGSRKMDVVEEPACFILTAGVKSTWGEHSCLTPPYQPLMLGARMCVCARVCSVCVRACVQQLPRATCAHATAAATTATCHACHACAAAAAGAAGCPRALPCALPAALHHSSHRHMLVSIKLGR
ncbi:hypothetical protein EON66_02815 [archaeon]|nr:MAG: hypothetical protein EON66_02815 [archaeon]